MELTVSERDYLLLEGRWGAIEKGQRAVTRGVIVPLVRISERVPSRSRREAAVAPASRAARGGWRRVRGRLLLTLAGAAPGSACAHRCASQLRDRDSLRFDQCRRVDPRNLERAQAAQFALDHHAGLVPAALAKRLNVRFATALTWKDLALFRELPAVLPATSRASFTICSRARERESGRIS